MQEELEHQKKKYQIQQRILKFRAASLASRDKSAAAHARTNVRRRVPNNRLPLSLGMLRTATGLQIVPTLRPHSRCQEISQGFYLPRRGADGIPNE